MLGFLTAGLSAICYFFILISGSLSGGLPAHRHLAGKRPGLTDKIVKIELHVKTIAFPSGKANTFFFKIRSKITSGRFGISFIITMKPYPLLA